MDAEQTPGRAGSTDHSGDPAGLHGGDVDATYLRAGFGAPVPRGPRPALIVVDLTRGFTESAFPSGSDLTPEVKASGQLVDAAHRAGVPVVFTVITFTEAEAEGDAIAWLRKAPGMRALREGAAEVELDRRLDRRRGDHLVVKKGASAFNGTTLSTLLSSLHIDTAVICGATTSGCVRATAVDAVQAGLDTLVVADASGDRATGPHDAALFDLQAKYADVIHTSEAVDYLTATRDTTGRSPR